MELEIVYQGHRHLHPGLHKGQVVRLVREETEEEVSIDDEDDVDEEEVVKKKIKIEEPRSSDEEKGDEAESVTENVESINVKVETTVILPMEPPPMLPPSLLQFIAQKEAVVSSSSKEEALETGSPREAVKCSPILVAPAEVTSEVMETKELDLNKMPILSGNVVLKQDVAEETKVVTGPYRISSLGCLTRVNSEMRADPNRLDKHVIIITPGQRADSQENPVFWNSVLKLFDAHQHSITSLSLEIHSGYPVQSGVRRTRMILSKTQSLKSLKIRYCPSSKTDNLFSGADKSNIMFPKVTTLKSLDLSEALVPQLFVYALVGTYGPQLTQLSIQSAVACKEFGIILRNLEELRISHIVPATFGMVGALLAGNSGSGANPKLTTLKMSLSGSHYTNLLFAWLKPFPMLRNLGIDLTEALVSEPGVLETYNIPGVMRNNLDSVEYLSISLSKVQESFLFLNWLPNLTRLQFSNVPNPSSFEITEDSDSIDAEVKQILRRDSAKDSPLWKLLSSLEEISVEWECHGESTKDTSCFKRSDCVQ